MKKASPPRAGRVVVSALQALLLVSVVACSSPKLTDAPPAPGPALTTTTPDTGKSPTQTAVKAVTAQPLEDSKSLTRRPVYFEYDSALVAPSSTAMLTEQSQYLRSHRSAKVRVEGNTDERGGHEYNLALGQKRADAVASAMKLLGVADQQMEAVSYGKEKPAALGHDEAAWSRNRKVDINDQTR